MFSLLSRFVISIFLFLVLPLQEGQGRWAEPEEAEISYDHYEEDVMVHKTGASKTIFFIQATALNEKGREILGHQRFIYNSDTTKIVILEAKVILNGKEYQVPKKMIETKPLASLGSGFDQHNQLLISFPQMAVGAQMHLKYYTETKQQPIPNYYADAFSPHNGLYKHARFSICSQIPFKKQVSDPRKSLTITEKKDTKGQHLTVTLDKPLYEAVANEVTIIPDELSTWVRLSTMENITELGDKVGPSFEAVVNQNLPPLLQTIKEEAQKLDNPIDQMNRVSSLLAEKIRYMGDWRTIKGRLTPHSLKEIANSGVGDCKDFSVAMGAILKQLGFDAHVALVKRGDQYLPSENPIPCCGLFNHAFLKVIDKKGKVYWIDPTNLVSMADGLFSDISDRPALVLSSKPSLEKVPPIDINHSKSHITKTLTIKENNHLLTEGVLNLQGEQALMLSGATLTNSPQVIKESLISFLSQENHPINKEVILPDLTSRIVKDLQVSYQYEQEDTTLLTNEGVGISLDSFWCNPYLNLSENQVGTLYVGAPSRISRIIHIKNKKINDIQKLDFHLKTPWLEVERKSTLEPTGARIEENISILKSFISAQEILSPEYKELRRLLKTYCINVAVILD